MKNCLSSLGWYNDHVKDKDKDSNNFNVLFIESENVLIADDAGQVFIIGSLEHLVLSINGKLELILK